MAIQDSPCVQGNWNISAGGAVASKALALALSGINETSKTSRAKT
jgi:hypothetical protein